MRSATAEPPRGAPPLRARLAGFIDSPGVQRLIVVLILVNAAILGLATSPGLDAAAGGLLSVLDRAILAVFVVELALRLIAHGWRFFRDPWSLFDLVVVGIALVPASQSFSALRAFRILRVLRLISVVPRMRIVVAGLLAAIPGLSSIVAILVVLVYVFAVIATSLFGASHPEWFGTLGAATLTLFQIMTLEGWADILREVRETHPHAWLFFIPFIMVTTFTMLNLFIAIIVGAMQSEHDQEMKAVRAEEDRVAADRDAALHADIGELRREIAALRQSLKER